MTTVLPVKAAADVSRSPTYTEKPHGAPISEATQASAATPAATPAAAASSAPVVSVSDLKEHEAKQKDFKKIEKVVKQEEKKDVKQLKVVEKDAKSKIKKEAKAAKELSKLQKKAKLKEVKHQNALTQAQAKYDASLTNLTTLTGQLDVKKEDHARLRALRDNKKATLEQVMAVKEENDATRKAVLDQVTPVLGQS